MHILQSKHIKLKQSEVQELLKKFRISLNQLPKIKKSDPGLPQDAQVGDVFMIERKAKTPYYRVVVP